MLKNFFTFLLIIFCIQGDTVHANKLANETSPYLLQHKDNPVNWYPWQKKAFELAKKENKLIFLSIGYSTCHWCHVMAHESFEDKTIAKILNKNFVNIKVDKEQFPHIDNYYQSIYKSIHNKSGGWPLTIIMTADKKPFFAGTYIPKEQGYGSKGLVNILNDISKSNKILLEKNANTILHKIVNIESLNKKTKKLNNNLILKVINQYKNSYDYKFKGFTQSPKFPKANNISLLLNIYKSTKNKDALSMANGTLTAMAKGGIYDQIEGGFYRYSVDKKWEIPHFEKMLYTNGELLNSYSIAYKITKNLLYKKTIIETVNQIDKRFKIDDVYKSASNADSKNFEGHNEEGFYFLYEYLDTIEYLEQNNIDEKTIKETLLYLGITEDGNFDGDFSNPNITKDIKPKNLNKIKSLLLKLRNKKKYPFIDNKINTAWNSLYIKGKLQASVVNKHYVKEATDSLDKLLNLLYIDDVLYHQTIIGIKPTQKALLEDYAFLSSALFEAYQKTLNKKYFVLFEKLTKESIEKFYKNEKWRASNDSFITYAKINNYSYASALAVTLNNLTLYATVQADFKILNIVLKTIDQFSSKLNKNPSLYPNTLQAFMMKQYEPVFIKASKNQLKTFKISEINYPFVYKYEYKSDDFLACKLSSCFSYGKDFQKVKNDIEALLN